MSVMLAAFNNHVDEMVDDLLRAMPGDPDILSAQAGIATSRRMNVSSLVRAWPEYTRRYSREIDGGDIRFFIEKDYAADLPTGSSAHGAIDRIRERAATLDESDQRKVMRYVKNLSTLAELYANKAVRAVDQG